MAQLALGVVGGVIGFFVGGPAGAAFGFSLGYGIGAYAFAPDGPTIEGPRLRDLTAGAGAEGAGIPIVYGTFRVRGEQLWTTNIVETAVSEEVGGKGGSESTQVSFFYSASFAVGLCEGPIIGVRRIWADSKLVYSVANGAEASTFAANTERGTIRIYTGTETQTQDPLYAATVGASVAPAFRGTAYLVFENWQLKDFGNRKPFMEAEVVTAGTREFPNRSHTISGNTFRFFAIDERRRSIQMIKDGATIGDALYRWDGSDTPPEAHSFVTADLSNDTIALGIDTTHDEYVVLEGFPSGTETWQRFDAATGASLGSDAVSIVGLYPSGGGASEAVETRSGIHWDAINQVFWTTGDGFDTGSLYLIAFNFQAGTYQALWLAEGGNDTNHNDQDLVDSDGQVWIAVGSLMIRCGFAPEVYQATLLGSPSDNPVAEAAFLWNARGEIWLPRVANHLIDGWHVFNLASRTFSNSVNLGLGSWTTEFRVGVENRVGHAWFLDVGLSTTDGELRNVSGELVNSFEDEFSSANIRTLFYVPGIIFIRTNAGVAASFYEDALDLQYWTLKDVVEDVCERSGVAAVNATELSYDVVRGAVITRPMPARRFLEPLTAAYAFDIVESGGAARCVKRGGAAVEALTDDDLGAYEDGGGGGSVNRLNRSRMEETDCPATIYVSFSNEQLDYNVGVARSRRLVTAAEQTISIELPLALTSEEANQIADNLMRFSWLERERFSFTLPPKFRTLEPTDVVTLPDGRRVRLIKIDYVSNGVVRCEGVSDDQGAQISYAVGNVGEVGTGVSLGSAGPTTAIVIDGPLLRDADNDEGVYIGGTGETSDWTGAVFYYSRDDGVTWIKVTPINAPAKIGVVVSGAMTLLNEGTQWDTESSITVQLVDPSLSLASAASEETFYNGANAFALTDGEDVEIVQFFTAVDNGDDTFTLTQFLRGRKGSEWAIRAWTTGTRFVLLESPQILRAQIGLDQIGNPTLWKAVTIGASLADEIADEEVFDAVSCKPHSPVGIGGARQPSGEYHIQWTRRARKRHEWRSGGDVPLDEPTESYELEIWDKYFETLYRTVEVEDETTFEYTLAMQGPDFGSPSPDAIGVKVFQMSDRVGRGYEGRSTIPVGSGHRYWRIEDITLNGGTFFEISEFHLYRGATRVDQPAAMSASDATSFGVVTAWQDNNTGTRCHWPVATAQADTFWVQWDFGFKAEVTGIRFASFSVESTRIPTALTLQYSDDGTNWFDWGSITGMTYPGTSSFTEVFRMPPGGA